MSWPCSVAFFAGFIAVPVSSKVGIYIDMKGGLSSDPGSCICLWLHSGSIPTTWMHLHGVVLCLHKTWHTGVQQRLCLAWYLSLGSWACQWLACSWNVCQIFGSSCVVQQAQLAYHVTWLDPIDEDREMVWKSVANWTAARVWTNMWGQYSTNGSDSWGADHGHDVIMTMIVSTKALE